MTNFKNRLAFFFSCVSCVSLVLTFPAAQAADLPPNAPPLVPVAQSQQSSKCSEGKSNMDKVCKPQDGNASSDLMAQQGAGGGMNNAGGDLAAMTAAGCNTNTQYANACEKAAKDAKDACDKEAQENDDKAQQLESNPMTAAQAPPFRQKALQLREDGKKNYNEGHGISVNYGSQAMAMCKDSGQSQAAADAAKTEPSGGGMGDMMGPLLAVGAGAAVLCIMGTICPKDEKKDEGASTIDGGYTAVDCEKKEDAYKNANCQDIFLEKCKANPAAKDCDKFANTHCGLGSGEDTGGGISPTDTTAEGLGSTYCQMVVSQRYCGTTGRETCPSCQNLARMSSPNCSANPSVCLPQMTQADKEASQVVCPTDPLFSNPLFMAQKTEGQQGDVPPGTGGGGTTTPGVVSSDGTTVASVGRNAGDGVGGNGRNYGGSGGYGVGGNSADAVGSSASRNIASTQVASGIAPALGSSLFARHSQVVNQRCKASRLNNCGPRSSNSSVAN